MIVGPTCTSGLTFPSFTLRIVAVTVSALATVTGLPSNGIVTCAPDCTFIGGSVNLGTGTTIFPGGLGMGRFGNDGGVSFSCGAAKTIAVIMNGLVSTAHVCGPTTPSLKNWRSVISILLTS
jgi:hypothetical protein